MNFNMPIAFLYACQLVYELRMKVCDLVLCLNTGDELNIVDTGDENGFEKSKHFTTY